MSLVTLPYELVLFVIQHLDLADICSLSFSCKKFQFLLHESSIARFVLETKVPYTAEARHARTSKRYASQLRRLIKRRDAIASVSPYLVAMVAVADTWLYENGVLCYIRGPQLRILDLHHSASHEIVVSIPTLLDEAVKEPRTCHIYQFRLLYYAHDIVSCLYRHAKHGQARCTNWLLVFNPQAGKIITARRLQSISQIFVRNNEQFLYYGTNSETGRDGYRRWVITAFDIIAGSWLDQKLNVPVVMGTDVNSTVCFEIFDDYFYGLSNQTSLEVEEVDWVSYYTCFRFPLTQNGFHNMELPPRRQFWRRSQAEGPIDDRWTFLRLFRDETNGELKVVESRKEWLSGSISARRTYYTTIISFEGSSILRAPNPGESLDRSGTDSSVVAVQKMHQGSPSGRMERDPHMVHPADASFSFTLNKCPVRAYYPSCQAYIDLVDDTTSFDPSDQQVRIRGGSRRLWAPGERQQRKSLPMTPESGCQDTFLQQIEHLYKCEDSICWPPHQNPSVPDPALADLYEVLNPTGHLGNLHGSWDERSLVYATGCTASGLALVFVSWDPSIRLAGVMPYPGIPQSRRANLAEGGSGTGGQSCLPTRLRHEDKGKDGSSSEWCPTLQPDATSRPGESVSPGLSSEVHADTSPTSWRALEPARYRDIARGYHFAR
ncbi:hypothetical protein VTK56DRAFT_3773 [Thermocarpiscus australiensis]